MNRNTSGPRRAFALLMATVGFLAILQLCWADERPSRPLSEHDLALIRGAGPGAKSVTSVNCDEWNKGTGVTCDTCPKGGNPQSCSCCTINPPLKGDKPSDEQAESGYNFGTSLANCGKKKIGLCNTVTKVCEKQKETGNCQNLERWLPQP